MKKQQQQGNTNCLFSLCLLGDQVFADVELMLVAIHVQKCAHTIHIHTSEQELTYK